MTRALQLIHNFGLEFKTLWGKGKVIAKKGDKIILM